MKHKIQLLTAAALCVGLTGCQSPFGNIGRIFPDGSSGYLEDAQLTASGTAVNISARRIVFSGTNGYPVVFPMTNSPMTIDRLPTGTVLRVR